MRAALRVFALIALVATTSRPGLAQPAPPPDPNQNYAPGELVNAGHHFFGTVSRGLATLIEKAVGQWGLPNGYVLGEEAGGAFFGGLRYGEGVLYTKNAGDLTVFWQGPSVGWDLKVGMAREDHDAGATICLRAREAIYQRFAGIAGSAYLIGGFGMTALTANNVVLVPIRSGVLGCGCWCQCRVFEIHAGLTTWNPF